jgi:hypothetical protein
MDNTDVRNQILTQQRRDKELMNKMALLEKKLDAVLAKLEEKPTKKSQGNE